MPLSTVKIMRDYMTFWFMYNNSCFPTVHAFIILISSEKKKRELLFQHVTHRGTMSPFLILKKKKQFLKKFNVHSKYSKLSTLTQCHNKYSTIKHLYPMPHQVLYN